MEQITTKFGIILKNGVYTLFENGTVNIFNNECEVFGFETDAARKKHIKDNKITIDDDNNHLFDSD